MAGKPAASGGAYLPPDGVMGPGMGNLSTVKSGPAYFMRSRGRENIISPVGRRGAGMTSLGGGDPGAHVFNHYGKKGPPGMVGGDL